MVVFIVDIIFILRAQIPRQKIDGYTGFFDDIVIFDGKGNGVYEAAVYRRQNGLLKRAPIAF